MTIAFSKNSSVCTPRESTLGVRETFDDLPPFRNRFEMSDVVELLELEMLSFKNHELRLQTFDITFDFLIS